MLANDGPAMAGVPRLASAGPTGVSAGRMFWSPAAAEWYSLPGGCRLSWLMPKTPSGRAPRQPRFERLTAWQAVHELNRALLRQTLDWPEEHRGFLGEELRTSATAAATHIVLGSIEADSRGFRRQLSAAIGKLARVDSTWQLVRDLNLVDGETWGAIEALRDHAERLTRGLYAALGRKTAAAAGRRG